MAHHKGPKNSLLQIENIAMHPPVQTRGYFLNDLKRETLLFSYITAGFCFIVLVLSVITYFLVKTYAYQDQAFLPAMIYILSILIMGFCAIKLPFDVAFIFAVKKENACLVLTYIILWTLVLTVLLMGLIPLAIEMYAVPLIVGVIAFYIVANIYALFLMCKFYEYLKCRQGTNI